MFNVFIIDIQEIGDVTFRLKLYERVQYFVYLMQQKFRWVDLMKWAIIYVVLTIIMNEYGGHLIASETFSFCNTVCF